MMQTRESDSFLGDIVTPHEVAGQLKVVTEIHVSRSGPFRVFLGERLGKRVILKTLKTEHADNRHLLMMLRKEFEIGFSLSHPGIATTLDYTIVEGLGECIIEEYIDGESLEKVLQTSEINPKQAYSILRSLVETLVYIHKKGIVHADLKPSNIIISGFYGMPKIIDFGFADSLDYASLKFAGGTSGYIAPERREKDYKPIPESDIWSVGEIIDKFANKIKGKEKLRLHKIAGKCKKPLGERINSAEELYSILKDAEQGHGRKKIFVVGISAATIALAVIGFSLLNAQHKDTEEKTGLISIAEPITADVNQTPDTLTFGNNLASTLVNAEKNSDLPTESKSNTGNNIVKESFESTSNTERNREKKNAAKHIDGEETESFITEALDYANNHIQETIAGLKERGLYHKDPTLSEKWNTHYIFNKIITEIEEYVSKMPIESEATKETVRVKAVEYARQQLIKEEQKPEE